MNADIRSGHTNRGVQESLEAETEFHIWTFKCIERDYRDEGVCYGTWIPVWAAAFNETVHMYEVSPVQPGWDEAVDRFPDTVFDMLDDTRKLEQAELESGRRLKLVRGVARITNQEWYPKKFARKKRGEAAEAEAEVDAAKAEAEVDVPIDDAFDDGLGGGCDANQMFECELNCGFESSDKKACRNARGGLWPHFQGPGAGTRVDSMCSERQM